MGKKKKMYLGLKLNKLDTIFIAGVSCLMLFVLMLFSVYTQNVKDSEEDLIRIVLERMSVNQKAQFEQYIDEKIQTLEGLAGLSAVYEMKDADIKALLKGNAKDFGFEYFFVMKADGVGYYFDEGVSDVYRNQKDEPFFKNIMEHEVYLTEPFYSDKRSAITTVCVSIRNKNKEKVGVLCGALKLRNIQSFIENSRLVLDGNVFLLNSAGNYISTNDRLSLDDKSKDIFQTPDSELSLIHNAFNAKEDQSGTLRIKGINYMTYISYLPDFHWIIVQCIPLSEVTARFQYIEALQFIMSILSVALFLCILRIIYSWRKSDKKIYMDVLTGCKSRAACFRILETLEKKHDSRISIIYMDLNKFKYVNDTYGHDEGDHLLQIFGKTLNKVFGKYGFVGRLGGDEFIAIVANESNSNIDAMCKEVGELLVAESKSLSYDYTITASFGYSSRDRGDTDSLDLIMQYADERMYKNKALHK